MKDKITNFLSKELGKLSDTKLVHNSLQFQLPTTYRIWYHESSKVYYLDLIINSDDLGFCSMFLGESETKEGILDIARKLQIKQKKEGFDER